MNDKRFSVKKSESGLFYRDGDFEIDNTIQFIIETVEMKLNYLSDENEQLKEQLEICKDARQAYKQDWKACVSYCDTYKDEIHTLKDNIQGLIEENKVLKNNVEKLSELCVKYDFKVGRLEEENEQLKQQLKSIEDSFKFSYTENHIEFNKDTLKVEDTHTELTLKDGKLYISVFTPQLNEYVKFFYLVTGRKMEREFINYGGDV